QQGIGYEIGNDHTVLRHDESFGTRTGNGTGVVAACCSKVTQSARTKGIFDDRAFLFKSTSAPEIGTPLRFAQKPVLKPSRGTSIAFYTSSIAEKAVEPAPCIGIVPMSCLSSSWFDPGCRDTTKGLGYAHVAAPRRRHDTGN